MEPERLLVGELDDGGHAALRLQQIAPIPHQPVILGVRRHGGPDRDDGLHPHIGQLGHQPFGIGPFVWVELPLPLPRPVEKVDHDAGERQAKLLVLAGDVQKLLLRPVAQLALPEARRPVGQFGRHPAGGEVAFEDRGGAVAGANPVIEPRRRIGPPAGDVFGEVAAPGGGVVPQEPVAAR